VTGARRRRSNNASQTNPKPIDLHDELALVRKIERAMIERTEQVQAALVRSQKELEAATAKRREIEAKVKH
jgi:hypothetical protein